MHIYQSLCNSILAFEIWGLTQTKVQGKWRDGEQLGIVVWKFNFQSRGISNKGRRIRIWICWVWYGICWVSRYVYVLKSNQPVSLYYKYHTSACWNTRELQPETQSKWARAQESQWQRAPQGDNVSIVWPFFSSAFREKTTKSWKV